MFLAEEDLTLHITRGDAGEIVVRAIDETTDGGETPYIFKAGEVLRLKVYEKKNCSKVVLQKDVAVTKETEIVTIALTEADTKIGDTISKPVDYWYEIELNPFTEPQTIVGYDEDGAKILRLYPEGKDTEYIPPTPEELGTVDKELDLTSERAIQNQAVARAVVQLESAVEKNNETSTEGIAKANEKIKALEGQVSVERNRITNLATLTEGSTTGDAELIDARVGYDGTVFPSLGEAVRGQCLKLKNETIGAIADVDIEILFNPENITLKKYIVPTTGELGVGASGTWVSDFMPLQVDTDYAITKPLITAYLYLYDENKAYLGYPKLTSDTFNISSTDYPSAKYFRVCGNAESDIDSVMIVYGAELPSEYTPYAKKEIKVSKETKESVIPTEYFSIETEGNGYVNTSGELVINANSGWRYSTLIPFITANIVKTASSNAILPIAFYNENKEYLGALQSVNALAKMDTFYLTEETIPTEIDIEDIKYIRVSTHKDYENVWEYGYKFKTDTVIELARETEKIQHRIDEQIANEEITSILTNILGSFDKVVCCGDSLTWGSVNRATRTDQPVNFARKPSATYPEVLAKITGTETKALATPGDDTTGWFDRYVKCNKNNSPETDQIALENADITKSEEARNHPLFLIYLGTNGGFDLPETFKNNYEGVEQLRAFLPNWVGSSFEHSGLDAEFETLAETYSGEHFRVMSTLYYARILQHLKYYGFTAVLVKPVVVIPVEQTDALQPQAHTIIDYLGEVFNFPTIELPDDRNEPLYHCYPQDWQDGELTNIDPIHYNDLGYSYLASVINQKINELSNLDKLKIMPQRTYENMGFPS